MNEKIQEFKMLWSEKLIKLGIAIFLIGLIVFLFKGSEIFDQLFLIMLLVGIVALLKVNFEFNRKVVILKDILVYYEDGRECHRAKITENNIKTHYKEKRAYRSRYKCKYMSINKFEIPIYSLGLKGSIELEKAIYEIQYKKNNTVIKNRLFTIPRERLIKEKYSDDNSGIELIITDGMVQFVAKKETMEYINKIFDKRTNPKLTKAAMEVLSIIAYNEDITRAEIENIRGVSSDAIIYKLIEYGLIKESGKRETLRKTNGI